MDLLSGVVVKVSGSGGPADVREAESPTGLSANQLTLQQAGIVASPAGTQRIRAQAARERRQPQKLAQALLIYLLDY
jgi:hypothetical protein